jgi:hypothetical protein
VSRFLSACLTIVVGLTLSGCAARLDPTWTINERTPVTNEATQVGLGFPTSQPSTPAADLQARTVTRCGPATVAHTESRGALRPGVGAHLRIDYWTTSAATIVGGPWSSVMPTRASFDGILRKVPAGGRLSAQEKVLLGTFLAVNRSYVSSSEPNTLQRGEAAKVVDAQQAILWNAFVENFCIEFLASPTEVTTSVLLFKSDAIRLCQALQDSDRDAFSLVFVHAKPNGFKPNGFKPCEIPTPMTSAASPPTLPRSTLLGTLQANARNTFGQVAAGAGMSQGRSTFYIDVGLQIAAVGEITLQRPRFGARGTETWSLADWEASGICVGENGERIEIAHVILRGGASFAIKEVGNYRVLRRLMADGYTFRVEAVDTPTLQRTLAHADLTHLTPADVVEVLWRSDRWPLVAAACSGHS